MCGKVGETWARWEGHRGGHDMGKEVGKMLGKRWEECG